MSFITTIALTAAAAASCFRCAMIVFVLDTLDSSHNDRRTQACAVGCCIYSRIDCGWTSASPSKTIMDTHDTHSVQYNLRSSYPIHRSHVSYWPAAPPLYYIRLKCLISQRLSKMLRLFIYRVAIYLIK